jgi:disulfide bond formation protein DsbB
MTFFFHTKQVILGLLLCSSALLVTVFYFEYVGGIIPCKLCIWQRLPHAIVVFLGIFALVNNNYRLIISLTCSLTIFSGFLLSGYHVGIEHKLWPGPQSCSGTDALNTLSPDLFLETILKAPITKCDEVTWSFLKISMAGWNFIFSFLLTIIWSQTTLQVFKTSKT